VGENQNQPFQLSFNPSLRVDFQGSRVTSDGGLVLVRELDERLGFSGLIARHLTDSRAKNTQLPLADLLRQSIYSRMAGYEDVNDAERLSQDPTFRLIGSEKIWERGAALTSRLQSFETELLTQEKNLSGLTAINREMIARSRDRVRVGNTYSTVRGWRFALSGICPRPGVLVTASGRASGSGVPENPGSPGHRSQFPFGSLGKAATWPCLRPGRR
jgi:Transposase DDE domain group 1